MRVLALSLVMVSAGLRGQDFGLRPKIAPVNPALAQVNAALEARDYATAIHLLRPMVAETPKDARLQYDLGSAEDALDQDQAAETNYRAAIADDAAMLDPHVALGLLLARAGRMDAARTELLAVKAATTAEAGLRARGFRALARIDRKTRPAEARDELIEALKLTPETPEDTLLGAELAANANNGGGAAEAAYRKVLAQLPNDPAATAELAHLLVKEKRAAEAETLLQAGLAVHPGDAALTSQLATTYAANGRTAEAVPLVEALHATSPYDANLSRLLANLYLSTDDYVHAEPLLAALAVQNPRDATLVADRGRALIHLKRFAEAEEILARVVAQPRLFPTPADLGNAAGDLAFAASANGDPAATLQALEVRATVLPTSAPALFLTAISHDKLHHVKLAQQAYKDFLAASKGMNADEEFEARHRLITLEHRK